ncbi:HIG1 domain family member 1A, mitochondrial-like [Melanaphis sacchari]|uniref:HIG1 domain family member 1A, mitochondrial-like n=1 Tax=Melanaphis sacchari TaxID=742174 RepID=UPI000DC13359|nr:HIG1 domain family member 1A, mitochondrial-like [Melanaphis sacchari]
MEEDNSFSSRFTKKSQQMPLYPVGILGFGLVAAYGLYKFKSRQGRTSLYLIQLRLAAQGTAVGIIGIGVLYNIINEAMSKKS